MPDLYGTAEWPGVSSFIACEYTCGHGGTPGSATLLIPFQDLSGVAIEGDLVLSDGINPPLVLRGCRVDRVERVDVPGGWGLALYIQDRRWRWRDGSVDGWFNQIDPFPDSRKLPNGDFFTDTGIFVTGTEWTPAEMIALCLDQLGERDYLIRGLTDDARPSADWVGANPAQAAQAIADSVGARMVFQPWSNRVIVVSPGEPLGLRDDWPILDERPGFDPPDPPAAVEIVGGPTWAADLVAMQPVGYEADGRVRHINDLSFKPAGGWELYVPENCWRDVVKGDSESIEQSRALAKQFVWRLYQPQWITSYVRNLFWRESDAPSAPPPPSLKEPSQPAARWLEIPPGPWVEISDRVYLPDKDATGQYKTEPAKALANAYNRSSTAATRNHEFVSVLSEPFTVDADRRLVTFSRPVYRIDEAATTAAGALRVSIPWAYLRCSVRIRAFERYGQLMRGRWTERLRQDGAVRSISRPELVLVYVVDRVQDANGRYNPKKVRSNEADMVQAAGYYLRSEIGKYETTSALTRRYAGLLPVEPDGGIHQVTWSIGTGPPTTTVSVNTEHATWLPPYPERRRNEKVASFLTPEWVNNVLGVKPR